MMEFIKIDPDKATSLELAQTIKLNCKTTKLMKKEIEKLEKINLDYHNNTKCSENNAEDNTETILEIGDRNTKTDFENKIDYYFSLIDSLPISENLNEEVQNILPSNKNRKGYI